MAITTRVTTFLIALLFLFSAQAVFKPHSSSALSGSDFDAARIIDDGVFFNATTMSPGDIQAFFNAKVPNCRSGYTCLKDFTQSYGTVAADTFCGTLTGGNKSAAQIIYDVSRECGINPQVLLVLLQKEQSLITDTWPVASQYRSATGYGCPDTAACDAQYYGFFNQVYRAARQFKRYVQQPNQYNYAVGRTSFIAYQALRPECGGTNVTIQTSATAALYNFTPYQPNAAALNNLYGTGDGCSAYGNRNFWRLFNDWFGTTYSGYLMRSVNNATVYLVSGSNKYPISDMNLYNSLQSLGPITYVSQQYLDNKNTGSTLGRLLRSSDGTIYFVDSGIKLPFGSCAMVSRYGLDCGNTAQVEDQILARLHTGPFMTNLYSTTSGKRFYIDASKKREVYDDASLSSAGISGAANMLNEAGLSHLTYGVPVVRNDTVLVRRDTLAPFIYTQNSVRTVDQDLYIDTILSNSLSRAKLDQQSISNLTSGGQLTGFIKNAASSKHYLLTDTGKVEITESSRWSSTYATLPDTLLNSIPTSSAVANSGLIIDRSGTVYFISNTKKRPIGSWDDLIRVNPQPTITSVSDHYTRNIPSDTQLLGPGVLVKTPDNGTVYMIDGLSRKIPLTTFSTAQDMGISTNVRTISASILGAYTTASEILSSRVTCNGKNYFASNGALHEVPVAIQSQYNLTYANIDNITCANLGKHTQPLTRFVRTQDGTIYYIENGKKRPFTSYQKYIDYGAGLPIGLSNYGASQIPTGSVAN